MLGNAMIECYDIKWDTDGQSVHLPDTAIVEIELCDDASFDALVDEQAADALSDKFGWLVFGYKWRHYDEPAKADGMNIDWEMLRNQKADLIYTIEELTAGWTPDNEKRAESMTGILHLIDAIQDDAAARGVSGVFAAEEEN